MPAARAGLEFVRTFYAAERPVVPPHRRVRATVAPITRDDVAAFHEEHVVAAGVTMVVAGDLAGLDVPGARRDRARRLGQRWTATAPASSIVRATLAERPFAHRAGLTPRLGADRDRGRRSRPRPLRRGRLGALPGARFRARRLADARVDAVLREEKGYTYGIRSSFRPRRAGGLFLTSGSVRADSTAESLRLLVELLESGAAGFSDKEIRSGVDFIARPLRVATRRQTPSPTRPSAWPSTAARPSS